MGRNKKIDDDLYFDYEDVHEFNDNCTSIEAEMRFPYVGADADYEDIYGTQSCLFGIVDTDKTNIEVVFTLSTAEDSVILEWDFTCSSKIKGLVLEFTELNLQEFNEKNQF